MSSSIPAADQREIIRLYTEELVSATQIGRRLNWSRTSISRVLRLAGVPLRQPGDVVYPRSSNVSEESVDRAVEMYQSGMSAAETGKRLNVHPNTIYRYVRLRGVRVRSSREGLRLHFRSTIAQHQRARLTARQDKALELLSRGDASTAELAAEMQINTQRTREVLDQLVRYGLVAKRPSVNAPRHHRWSRTKLALVDVLQAAITEDVVSSYDHVWLPIAPLREWIENLVAHEEQRARFTAVASTPRGDGTGGLPTLQTVAKRLGTSERRLSALRLTQQSVTLRMADRLLTNAGDGTRLDDLWPELADDGDIDTFVRPVRRRQEEAA